jgi:hypothetical protein
MAKVQKGSVQTGKGDPWGEGACLRSVRCVCAEGDAQILTSSQREAMDEAAVGAETRTAPRPRQCAAKVSLEQVFFLETHVSLSV